jgi:membrane associated rhomboid family serine protease
VITAEGLWEFVIGSAALAILAVTALTAWPFGRQLADRYGSHRTVAVLFVIAVGIIAALTLAPNHPPPGMRTVLPPHYLTTVDDPRLVWAMLTAAPSDPEQLANIALYVPLGLLGALMWRGISRAVLFGAALTVFIETCQAGIVGRAGSITDIRNNAAGALLGAVVGAGAVRTLSRTAAGNGPDGRR